MSEATLSYRASSLFFRNGTILRLPFTSIADPVPAQQ